MLNWLRGTKRRIFATANLNKASGKETLLFIDEIHRFNKAQQDVLLPVIENGTIVLVGTTTENPSFELNWPVGHIAAIFFNSVLYV